MNAETMAQLAGAFVVGGTSAALVVKRLTKSFSVTGAEIDIVEQLRREVRRLAEQNERLANTVNEMQLRMIEVRRENAELRALLHAHSRNLGGDDA